MRKRGDHEGFASCFRKLFLEARIRRLYQVALARRDF